VSDGYSEYERLRDDDDGQRDDISGFDGSIPQAGVTFIAKTATKTTYPTVAGAFFWCTIQTVTGAETEGGAATYTSTGKSVMAFNLGSSVPPSGTPVIIEFVSDRYVFRYP
jgi:hypothetical protein